MPNTSPVTKYFQVIENGARAQCRFCGKKYQRTGSNTTGPRYHLRTVHKKEFSDVAKFILKDGSRWIEKLGLGETGVAESDSEADEVLNVDASANESEEGTCHDLWMGSRYSCGVLLLLTHACINFSSLFLGFSFSVREPRISRFFSFLGLGLGCFYFSVSVSVSVSVVLSRSRSRSRLFLFLGLGFG